MLAAKTLLRYSTAFKQKVVAEIESGKFSLEKARKIYDIGGGSTIQSWLKKFGKNHLLAKVVRVEMKDETDKLQQQAQQIQQLESALAQAHLKNICFESLLECVEEHYQIDVKKNFGTQVQQELLAKAKNHR
jgi:transposase-like protein